MYHKLPYEIKQKILLYLPFEILLQITNDKYIINKVYNEEIHTCDWAIEKGYLDVLKFLFHNNHVSEHIYDVVIDTSRKGHLKIVEWVLNNYGRRITYEYIKGRKTPLDVAAMYGHLDIVKWLHYNYNKLTGISKTANTDAMDYSAEAGHLDIVQWLHENRKEGCTTEAIDCAASQGHLDIIKWLHKNRKEGCTRLALESAKQKGHLKIVEWLKKNIKEYKPIPYY